MAREVQEIYDEIIQEKESLPSLNDLTSPSNVSVWRSWAFITSTIHRVHEVFWDMFKSEVDAKAAAAVPGTPEWYVRKSLEFQYGDTLQVINGVAQYSSIDLSKRIVAVASITEDMSNGSAILKLAREVSGNLIALDNAQLTAFKGYLNKFRFAGSKVTAISGNADLIKMFGTVYYNPLIPLSDTKELDEAAINNFLKNIPFNGAINRNALIDAIQKVTGVVDIVFNDIQVQENGGTYIAMGREYPTQAGYVIIDASFPLSSSLQYTAS